MMENTISVQMWYSTFQDTLMANSVIMQASASAQKSAYDNWQIVAKTQFGILNKQNKLVLDFAGQQDKTFQGWEKYVSGG